MKNRIIQAFTLLLLAFTFFACSTPKLSQKQSVQNMPEQFADRSDSVSSAQLSWREFFTDSNLVKLIDTALVNNQELNIINQRLNRSQFEIRSRKGEYLPFINFGAGAGLDKVGRYSRKGALEAITYIEPGEEFPEPLPDFMVGAFASWEIDIWNKLHNAKKAAVTEYLASAEGKKFATTQVVAEIAASYYELLALDNQLRIIERNLEIQTKALQIVKLQKKAAKVTELAVRKFEAEVFKNRSKQYKIRQDIVETENRINFLLGRFPQRVERSRLSYEEMQAQKMFVGTPIQLLESRTDIKQAELELAAAKLDVKVAKANFYPSLELNAAAGYQAYKTSYWLKSPESLLYGLAADLMAPLVNRNAIKAAYKGANSKQIQAVYEYEQTLLKAYIEVANQMAKVQNLASSYEMQAQQVEALNRSIQIANGLFKSARADYMEVLMTQRDALESEMELIETKQQQMDAMVNMYKALGGGWQ